MKKFISLFTMVAFIIFSLSCYSTKNMRLDADSAEKVKKGGILSVVMNSGVTIEFSKEQPGRIQNGSITGTAIKVTGELDKAYIKEIKEDRKTKILSFMVSIPLSEVEQVRIKKFKLGSTILLTLGVIGIAFLTVMAIVISDLDES